MNPSLSVVIVSYESAASIAATLEAIEPQLGPADQLIVVDNASSDGSADAAERATPGATVIRNAANDGFATGCNLGATEATGELLLFLNPDAVVAGGFREAIERPWNERPGWAAWMGLVTSNAGTTINTSGNVLHFTGIGWAGQDGEPIDRAPDVAREVAYLSGACFAIRRSEWERQHGFPDDFFMYCEDADLSLRLRLAGVGVGVEPTARADHDYEFAKGSHKWRLLERNRWSFVLRTYPGALLAVVFPALVATELALWLVSLAGGWGAQKLLANVDVLRALPRLIGERRSIQSQRRIGAKQFARWLTPDLDSPHLGRLARSRILRLSLRIYWRIAFALLPGR